MDYPTLEQTKKIIANGDFNIVPISKEICGDGVTPIEVMRILKKHSEHCFMLESVDDTKRWSRYTFLGFEPVSKITCLNNVVTVADQVYRTKDPQTYIRQILRKFKSPKIPELPSFIGDLVGDFAYDYFKYNKSSLNLNVENDRFNDIDLMLFDQVICFDNYHHKIILIVNANCNDLKIGYQNAIDKIERLEKVIFNSKITYAKKLMTGKSSLIKTIDDKVFKGIVQPFLVARCHSLAVVKKTIASELKILAISDDDEVVAVKHRDYPVYGLQFHPESI